jgi:integrase
MTLQELMNTYAKKKLKLASPNTLRLYRHSIVAFGRSIGHEPTTADLTDDNLELHMQRLVDAGLAIASANKDHAQLTALWRFANRNRLCETWPNVVTYPEPERVPLGWLPSELDRLFHSIEQEAGAIHGAPANLWWKTLLCVILDSGERIGAIRRLTKESIQGNSLLVAAKYRKGRTREKLFGLSPETLHLLATLQALHRSNALFPWDRCDTYIYNRFNTILKRAGLPTDRRSKFHRIRRTVASAVKNQGGDATAAMDHANPRTTKRYLDPRIVGETTTATLVGQWRQAAVQI